MCYVLFDIRVVAIFIIVTIAGGVPTVKSPTFCPRGVHVRQTVLELAIISGYDGAGRCGMCCAPYRAASLAV